MQWICDLHDRTWNNQNQLSKNGRKFGYRIDDAWNAKSQDISENGTGKILQCGKKESKPNSPCHSNSLIMHITKMWVRINGRGAKKSGMWSTNITLELPHVVKITLHKFHNLFYCSNTGPIRRWYELRLVRFRYQSFVERMQLHSIETCINADASNVIENKFQIA